MSNSSEFEHLAISQQYEEAENEGSNPSANPTLGDVIAARLSRRDLMKGLLGVSAITATVLPMAMTAASEARAQGANTTPSFNFKELAAGSDERHYVAEGYDADVLIRWGDKVLPDAPEFDPTKQTAEAQAKQFGYNNDFLGYIPMNGRSDHGLLVVNHEYTNEELMFPKIGRQDAEAKFAGMTKALADIEMMAHGGAVLEVKREGGKWKVVDGSKYARRITTNTEMRVSGPAAGHDKMKTKADPTGIKADGSTGSQLLPNVSPTFEWIRLAQRIPVRIVLDDPPKGIELRVGTTASVLVMGGDDNRIGVFPPPAPAILQ